MKSEQEIKYELTRARDNLDCMIVGTPVFQRIRGHKEALEWMLGERKEL